MTTAEGLRVGRYALSRPALGEICKRFGITVP